MEQRIYTDVKEHIRDYWNDGAEKYDNFPGHGLRSKEEKAIEHLPFYGGVSQEKIVSLLETAGCKNVEAKPLTEILQVEKKVFPWYYRLSYGGFLRYIVTAMK